MDEGLRFDVGSIRAAQDTSDGFRRVYMRLAKADHPYEYFNTDGTRRIEVITTDELFAPRSANTAKGLPIFNGHPTGRVDSKTITAPQGAMGDRLFRERTDAGDFLGVVSTLWTEEAKQRADKYPGVSPGYRVQVRRDSKGQGFSGTPTYFQSDRTYNHLASGVVPRGGDDVRSLFEGLRVDSAEDSNLWIATATDCYECDVNDEFADFALRFRGDAGQVDVIDLQGDRIDLNRQTLTTHHDDADCGCDECAAKKKRKKVSNDDPLPKPRTDMASLTIGGATWDDVPESLVSAVNPLIGARNDSAEAEAIAINLMNERDELQTNYDSLQAEFEELSEASNALAAEVQEMENRTDGEEGDRIDEDQMTELAQGLAELYVGLRNDAELLVQMGHAPGDDFDDSFTGVLEHADEIQRAVIAAALPSGKSRADDADEATLENLYQISRDLLKESAETRGDGNSDRADGRGDRPTLLQLAQNMRRTDSKGGDMTKKKGRKPKYMAMLEADLERQNAAFDGPKPAIAVVK